MVKFSTAMTDKGFKDVVCVGSDIKSLFRFMTPVKRTRNFYVYAVDGVAVVKGFRDLPLSTVVYDHAYLMECERMAEKSDDRVEVERLLKEFIRNIRA